MNILHKILYPKNNFGLENDINRERWLQKTLTSLPAGIKILDAGAGELKNKKFCTHLDYTSQDFCQYDGKGDGQGLQINKWDTSKIDIVSDITNIPVESESYDAILCSEVLEHLPEPHLALAEFNRILKKGGQLILTAPFCSMTHFAPFHFSSGFNRYYYEHFLRKLNFSIESLYANGNFFSYLAQELFRTPMMSKEYAGKTISPIKKFLLLICIQLLAQLARHDKGSSAVMCYGYFLTARKN